MPAESSREPGQDHIESLIDDVIRDILNEAGASSKAAIRGRASTAALIETGIAAPRVTSPISTLERALLAEAFASALAEALASALAEVLVPSITKVLDRSTSGEAAEKGPGKAARTSERGRKSETR
jgi:hypothetical protein